MAPRPIHPRPAARRTEPNAPSVLAIVLGPALAGPVLIPLVALGARSGSPWLLWPVAGLVVALVAWTLGQAARIIAFRRRLVRTDGFLCLNCQYRLQGLPDEGSCPECGEAYSRQDLLRRWSDWLERHGKEKLVTGTNGHPPRPG